MSDELIKKSCFKLLRYRDCLILFFISVLSPMTHAGSCQSATLQTTSTELEAYTVQHDFPVGGIIAQISTPSSGTYATQCAGDNTFQQTMSKWSVATSIASVYATNVPGVGVRLFNGASARDDYTFESPSRTITSPTGGSWVWGGGLLQLIKTGPITPGTLSDGIVGSVTLLGYDQNYHDVVHINTTGGTISVISCSVTSGPGLLFQIGKVSIDQFTAIGDTSKETGTKNVGLNCDVGTNINVTLNGTQNADTTDDSVLALSPATGAATGVGVQLLYGDKPLELNKM